MGSRDRFIGWSREARRRNVRFLAYNFVVMPGAGQTQALQSDKQPLYTITINVVARTTKAINYQQRSGATKIEVRALFELVRMHRIFDIYGTREEAVRAFQSTGC